MPQSKRSKRFKKSNPDGFKKTDSQNDQSIEIENVSKSIENDQPIHTKNDMNSDMVQSKEQNTNCQRQKKQKTKFVKTDLFDIKCKPGTSSISSNQNLNGKSNQKSCVSKPGTSQNANTKRQESSIEIFVKNSVDWKITESNIPFPKHEKYGKATHHQGSLCYSDESRSRQCTGMSVTALVMLNNKDKYTYESLFKTDFMDSVLAQGDTNYLQVSNRGGRLMEFSEYDKKILTVDNEKYLVDLQQSDMKFTRKGMLKILPPGCGETLTILSSAIRTSFIKYSKLLMMMGEYAIAVTQCHSKFLVFDSHGRCQNGSIHDKGAASLWSFATMDHLYNFLYYQCIRFCSKNHQMVQVIPLKLQKQSNALPTLNPWMNKYIQSQNQMAKKHNELQCEKAKKAMTSNQSNNNSKQMKAGNNKSESTRKSSRTNTRCVGSDKKNDENKKSSRSVSKKAELMRAARQNEKRRQEERLKFNANRKRKRENESYREDEQVYEKNHKRRKRHDPVEKELDRSKNSSFRAERRKKPKFHEHETSYNSSFRAERRNDPEFYEHETSYNYDFRVERRADPEYRKSENLKLSEYRRKKKTENPEFRAAETARNSQTRRNLRENEEYQNKEREYNTSFRKQSRMNVTFRENLKRFRNSVSDGCIYACVCCHRLMFNESVDVYNQVFIDKINALDKNLIKSTICELDKNDEMHGKQWICRTCSGQLLKKRMPKQCAKNGLEITPLCDADGTKIVLGEMEYVLISRVICFMKIFQLPRSRWSAIKDKCVYVPIPPENVANTMNQILYPRLLSEAGVYTANSETETNKKVSETNEKDETKTSDSCNQRETLSNDSEPLENIEKNCNIDLTIESTDNENVCANATNNVCQTDHLMTSGDKSDVTNDVNSNSIKYVQRVDENDVEITSDCHEKNEMNEPENDQNNQMPTEKNDDVHSASKENHSASDSHSKDALPTKTVMKRKLGYKNVHKQEYVNGRKVFKSLYALKRQGHPDYQDIDQHLRKDYSEKFIAQGVVAQNLYVEQQNETIECDDGLWLESMFDEEFEFENDNIEKSNENNRNNRNDMEGGNEIVSKESVNDPNLTENEENRVDDDDTQPTQNDETLRRENEKLSPEEDEFQEYKKNDPVAKWQYQEDDHMLYADMSPENLFNFETMSCSVPFSNVEKPNPIHVTENISKPSTSTADGNTPSVPSAVNSPKPSTSTADGNTSSVPSEVNSPKPSTSTADGNTSSVPSAVNDPTVTIAPGEGQIPINILGMKNYDIKACPHLHPDGKNGVDQDRVVKMNTTSYIDQRLNNKNPAFSDCKGWLYSMASKLEKEQLESKMSLGYTKGTLKDNADGTQSYSLDDPFAVLDKISNSPKFWQGKKADNVARLKNFGPFQIFYTLSCGEKRYAENIATLLRKKYGKHLNITIRYDDRYDDNEEVEVNENHEDDLFREFAEEMLFADDTEFDTNEKILSSNINGLSDEMVSEETSSMKNPSKTPSKKRKRKYCNDRSPYMSRKVRKNVLIDSDSDSDLDVGMELKRNVNSTFIEEHETPENDNDKIENENSSNQKETPQGPIEIEDLGPEDGSDDNCHSTQRDKQDKYDEHTDVNKNDVSNPQTSSKDSESNNNRETGSNEKEKPKRKVRFQILIDGIEFEEWLKLNKKQFDINSEMRQNVLMLTRHFDYRLRMFKKHFMMGKNNPMHTKYYSYRIEFQSRGAGHAHGVLWLDLDAVQRDKDGKIIRDPETNETYPIFPGVKEAMKKVKNDQCLSDTDMENLVKFADTFVTVSLTDPDTKDIVSEVNIHGHSFSCRKYGDECRFGFPKYTTTETIIAVPYQFMQVKDKDGNELDMEAKKIIFDEYQSVLKKVKKQLEDDKLMTELEVFTPEAQIIELCKISKVSVEDYKNALKYSFCSYTIHHKRTIQERMVNNYNKEWILAWDSNMDIQICLDFYAVITYISDYVTKDEKSVNRVLLEAVRKNQDKTLLEKMRMVADLFSTHRSMGEAEVYYRVLPSLHLCDSNVKTEFLATGFPNNRSKMLTAIPETEKEKYPEEAVVSMNGKLWLRKPSVHEKYARRPKALEKMTLIQFVKMYDSKRDLPKSFKIIDGISHATDNPDVKLTGGKVAGEKCVATETEDLEYHKDRHKDFEKIIITSENDENMTVEQYRELLLPRYIEISDPYEGEPKYMCLRINTGAKAIRTHNFQKSKNNHEFLYSELLQYTPWRNEEKDLHLNNSEACADCYNEKVSHALPEGHVESEGEGDNSVTKVNKVKSILMEHLEDVEEGKRKAAEILDERVGAALDPEFEQELGDGELEGMELHPDFLSLDPPPEIETSDKTEQKYREIELKDEGELLKQTRRLDEEQMMVLDECIQFAKKIKQYMKNGTNYPQIPNVMVQGGAGSGKSTVINTIVQWMERVFRTPGDNPEHPYIIKAAPTGTAAAVINGQTMHNAFGFNWGNDYIALNDKARQLKREILKNLKVIIIDEISMVKSDMLYQLNLRLQEVMERSGQLFGGVSVYCFGDLMQLQPVKGKWIFKEPQNSRFTIQHQLKPLWEQFDSIKLVKNHRQGADGRYADLLNRLRIGENGKIQGNKSKEEFEKAKKQYEQDINDLKDRVRKEGDADLMNENIQYVVRTNKQVKAINDAKLAALNTEEHIEQARHSCETQRNYKPHINENGFIASAPYIDELKMKVGAKCMLTTNVHVNDSLTNGAMGEILGFKKKNGIVSDVIIHFYNPDSGKKRRMKPQNADLVEQYPNKRPTPIKREEFEYSVSKKNNGASVKAKLIQFPIRLAFAVTAHKFQGQTVHNPMKLVVDLRLVRSPAQAYVMLSRVQSIDQIYILEEFDENALVVCQYALKEVERLDSIAKPLWTKPDDAHIITIQNIRSLTKHFDDIVCKSNQIHRQSDVLILPETWLSQNNDGSSFKIDQLGLPKLANVGQGKGLAVYSRLGFDDEKTKKVVKPNYQMIKIEYDQFIVIGVYRSKGPNVNQILVDILKFCDSDKMIIIGGDFNICACTEKENVLIKGLNNAGFKQLVQEATHEEGRTIDHCYVRKSSNNSLTDSIKPSVSVKPVYFSDHDAIVLTIPKK